MNESLRQASVQGVVLAGGRSTRMGAAKPWLPIAAELMLQRVVRLLGEVVRPVVVVSRVRQELPDLPPWAQVVHDRHENSGPMEGLAAALECVQECAEAVFVIGCDAPLLQPPFVRRMIELADDYDVVVPRVDGFDEPLVAVYRTRILPRIRGLLAAGDRRIASLFEQVATRRVTADELKEVDPQLQSLVNVNDAAAYSDVLRRLDSTR
jgi:molybdenum cofactor guanylyltransferase